jgi:hypothetical protein
MHSKKRCMAVSYGNISDKKHSEVTERNVYASYCLWCSICHGGEAMQRIYVLGDCKLSKYPELALE